MTELFIYATIVILAICLSLYQLWNTTGDTQHSAYYDHWWWTMPM